MLQFKVEDPCSVILPIDPALDQESSEFDKYVENRFDEKYLVFKPGEQPTRFKVRQTNHRSRVWINQHVSEYEQNLATIRWGLLSIENGGDVPPVERASLPAVKDDVVKESWINEHFNLPAVAVNFLAGMIRSISELSPFLSL